MFNPSLCELEFFLSSPNLLSSSSRWLLCFRYSASPSPSKQKPFLSFNPSISSQSLSLENSNSEGTHGLKPTLSCSGLSEEARDQGKGKNLKRPLNVFSSPKSSSSIILYSWCGTSGRTSNEEQYNSHVSQKSGLASMVTAQKVIKTIIQSIESDIFLCSEFLK